MTDSISVTVPLEHNAITRAIDFLHGLDVDLGHDGEVETPVVEKSTPTQRARPKTIPETPAAPTMQPGDKITIEGVEGEGEGMVPGVELDSDGLPHDPRIHGAARKKTAKDQKWKKIRGVSAELVTTVEAELRVAMAASPDAPVESVPTPEASTATPTPPPAAAPTPAPVEQPEVKYLVEGEAFTADQLKASNWTDGQIAELEVAQPAIPSATAPVAATESTITFPELMGKITSAVTSKQIVDTDVTAALNAQGLTSLPLLASRPDLIPAVHTALFG